MIYSKMLTFSFLFPLLACPVYTSIQVYRGSCYCTILAMRTLWNERGISTIVCSKRAGRVRTKSLTTSTTDETV